MWEWIFIVKGRVQGVAYRASVLDFIFREKLSVFGTVANLRDGTVEVLAQAEHEEDLERLLLFLRQGPPLARVKDIAISKRKISVFDFDRFSLKHA